MDSDTFSGGQRRSSCNSQLDFVGYWADKTVEEAVLKGTQLRQEKQRPLPTRECNLKNIDFIKSPCGSKNCGRRKKSPKKNIKRQRSRSRISSVRRECLPSQSDKTGKRKKRQRSKNKPTCGMRTAELAVPTKRQCLDTWRNKCNTLPEFMIERLRQRVMDLRPVVQISDAIHCFKRKSCKRERKNERSDNTTKRNKKTKDLIRMNENKTLSAVFGHLIAKKLNIPMNIVLNSDLQKIAIVISYDIADLICKSGNIDINNRTNQNIHREITDKITIWISDVLDESSYKIVEDEWKDFEEEAGPVLAFVDDLVDSALNICVPVPEFLEEPWVSSDKVSWEHTSMFEEKTINELPETDVYDQIENLEDYFQNALITMINDIEKDKKSDKYQDVGYDPEWESRVDVDPKDNEMNEVYLKFKDTAAIDTNIKNVEYLEFEDIAAINTDIKNGKCLESADATAIDADINNDKYLESADAAAIDTDIKNDEYLESADAAALDTDIKNDEYLDSADATAIDTDIKNNEYLESADTAAIDADINDKYLESADAAAIDTDIKYSEYLELTDAAAIDADIKNNEYLESADAAAIDTDIKNSEYLESADAAAIDADIKNNEYLESADAAAIDTDIKNSEYLESADAAAIDADIKNNECLESVDAAAIDADIQNGKYLEPEDASAIDTNIKNNKYLESENTAGIDANIKNNKYLGSEDATSIDNDKKNDKYLEFEDAVATDTDIKNYEYLESEDAAEIDADIKNDEYLEYENAAAIDADIKKYKYLETEDASAIDTDIKNDEYLESDDGIPLQTSENEADDAKIKYDEFLETEDVIEFQKSENPDQEDADVEKGDNHESESEATSQPSDMVEIIRENTDDINEAFADATDENIEPSDGFTDDNNKKVQFDEIVIDEQLITEPKSDVGKADWKASIDKMDFAAPNEDLLSDADESWPGEIQPPVVRPSQSVSKSITSLGNINEDEERLSILTIETSSDTEKQVQDNILVEPLEDKTEYIESQNTTDQLISAFNNAEDLGPPQQDPIIELSETPAQETTSKYGDKIDKKLIQKEAASKDLEKADAVTASQKDKRIPKSINKSSSKKPPQIAKKIRLIKPPRAKIETSTLALNLPQPIPKAKIVKTKTKTPKVKSEDIGEIAGISQSVKELDCDDVEKAKDVKFSSLRVNPRPDYRVHADTAPAWITRTYGEPTCICVNVDYKSKVKGNVMSRNDIRRWCRDLAKGYENLKMWNEWIDNTSRTVCMLQEEISALERPEGSGDKEWIKLKRNIDKDATLWKKINCNTRERIKHYKNMYQKRSEVKTNYYKITCNCSEHPI